MMRFLAFVAVSTAVLVGPSALAQGPAGARPPEEAAPPGRADRLESMWRFELAYRGNFVTDSGYNPFSTQDYLSEISLNASRTLFVRHHLSLAAGLAWDYGKSSATARGDATSLDMHRLTLPLEGRVHFGEWGYVFARAAPGVATERAEVDDPSAPCEQASGGLCPAPLRRSQWLFATDVSAGYAFPIWSRAGVSELVPRMWVQADGGYGWVASQQLHLAPDLASGDSRLASGVDLGSLTMRGAFFRVGAAVSF